MKFIRRPDWKFPKPSALVNVQNCLRTRWQKISKIGSREGHNVLIGATTKTKTKTKTITMTTMTRRTRRPERNAIFTDKTVAAFEDLKNFHKILPPKRLKRATKETFMYDGSFYQAVGSVLLMAEFFALMPVKGVKGNGTEELSFSWASFRTLYSVALIVMSIFDNALTLYMVLNDTISFNSVEPVIFRISNVIVCVSFLDLAKNWPDLMLKWQMVEKQLPEYVTQVDKGRMANKIRMVVFVAMMLSLVEHLLNIIATIHYANYCPFTDDPIENFFLTSVNQFFYTLPYSVGLAWFGKILNVMLTFAWNYMDCFVMIISIGLTSLFKQINDDLLKHKGMQMPPSFWSERRLQYRNVCVLCEKVDNAISVITMVSFSNNLYFICVQLLKSINKMPSIAHAMYFYFSLFFLLGRTMAVSLYSADIHDESKKPLRCLRCVPKESWCQEVKRFSDEVSSDYVALSGMKFFHLTRKLVLSVAGTIVTYELVLIQFRTESKVWDCERKDLQ